MYGSNHSIILLGVLVCRIAVYFYELCFILTNLQGESKYMYKQRVKNILWYYTPKHLIRDLLSNINSYDY